MNLELFDEFMEWKRMPSQCRSEWLMFLEICEMYLRKHKIKKPIVVELGTEKNRQRKFWIELLGMHHIGIDVSKARGVADIVGNIHDPKTLEILKTELGGNPISILFIDANHSYKDVRKDFEMYSPLCDGIVAIHDIESHRYNREKKVEVWKFWDELKLRAYNGMEEYKNFLFLAIHQHMAERKKVQMGIGVIIKK